MGLKLAMSQAAHLDLAPFVGSHGVLDNLIHDLHRENRARFDLIFATSRRVQRSFRTPFLSLCQATS